MGSTIFFKFRKKTMSRLNFRTKQDIVSKLGEVMGLMNLKNAKEIKRQNILSSRHANFLNIKFYENGTPPYLLFELAEYYLHPKYLGKICYGLHFRPLRSFILSLYIYYSKRPPSCFNRWFIRFARPIKSSIFDMRHLLVISPRESVFFLIVMSAQFTKTRGVGNRTKRRQMEKEKKCITIEV